MRESGVAIDSIPKWYTHVDGMQGTQSIHLNDDDDTIIPMKICSALCCFEHFPNDTSPDIPTKFLTNPGPWEPQTFYDADDTMDLVLTPTSIAYTIAHEPSSEVIIITQGF